MIFQQQKEYYAAIYKSTQLTNSAPFIEFILESILNAISQSNFTQENTQERILELLKINSKITRKELANALNKTPDSIKHHLQQLTKKGIIKHIGSTKTGEWLIL